MRRDWSGGGGGGSRGARAAWWELSKRCCAEEAGTRAALGPPIESFNPVFLDECTPILS